MGTGTRLGRVRGLGSSKHGAGNWLAERLSSIALVPLSVWLLVSLLTLPLSDHGKVAQWAAQPFAATFLILFVVTSFWHTRMGLTTLIEDYWHGQVYKVVTLVAMNLLVFGGAVFGVVAIARNAFVGAA